MGRIAAEDKYNGAASVVLTRSGRLQAFIAAAALATLALVAATPVPPGASILAATYAACVALFALHRARCVHHLALDLSGVITLDGREGALRHPGFVAPWLTVIRWRPAGARFDRTLPVLPDMLPAADFRHLRVILRLR